MLVATNIGPVVAYLAPERAAVPTAAAFTASRFPSQPAPAIAAEVPLRIASANVFFLNRSHDSVIAWARQVRPDVLLLIEVTAEWHRALAPLEGEFPYRRYVTDHSHHGLLLLSRWPLSAVVTRPPEQRELRPVLFATVTRAGAALRLAAMHATWPLRPADASERARDFAALATEASRRGSLPFMALGDLNVSPFSPQFATLLRRGGLRSAAAGHGWQPTWPSVFPPLGIQIDHALVSPEVRVMGFQRGPANGSDHRPIIVDVIIPGKDQLLSYL